MSDKETVEGSGFSCSYYEVIVTYPRDENSQCYKAECEDIATYLNLTHQEAAIFSEIWRVANSRQGKKKSGNTNLRSAEKILFYAQRIHQIASIEDFSK